MPDLNHHLSAAGVEAELIGMGSMFAYDHNGSLIPTLDVSGAKDDVDAVVVRLRARRHDVELLQQLPRLLVAAARDSSLGRIPLCWSFWPTRRPAGRVWLSMALG